jgi:uncharacterized membrane protein YebE (DUF533 family)
MERDAFLALSGIIWADGVVVETEAVAFRAAARAVGLSGPDLAAVENATEAPVDLDGLDVQGGELPDQDREFLYAIAVWLAVVDGYLAPEEEEALTALAQTLGLTEAQRDRGTHASVSIAQFAVRQGRDSAVLDLVKQVESRREEQVEQ